MSNGVFVCDGSAGRSQRATAFAERERDQRRLEDAVEIGTGGLVSFDSGHDDIVDILRRRDIDNSNRTPEITADDVVDTDSTVTMGCSVADFVSDDWNGPIETRNLDQPGGDRTTVRAQYGEICRRVEAFFDRFDPTTEYCIRSYR